MEADVDRPDMTAPLAGYGLPDGSRPEMPRRGCIIDLRDPAIRAAAIETGLVWSGPHAAQVAAVLDIAGGRVERPTYPMPDWAEAALAASETSASTPDATG
jgi:hypothetical protein